MGSRTRIYDRWANRMMVAKILADLLDDRVGIRNFKIEKEESSWNRLGLEISRKRDYIDLKTVAVFELEIEPNIGDKTFTDHDLRLLIHHVCGYIRREFQFDEQVQAIEWCASQLMEAYQVCLAKSVQRK